MANCICNAAAESILIPVFLAVNLTPAFTYNAGTSGSRDEYIGAATLFVPLNCRVQLGLTVPFVDSLQSNDALPSETSFGDLVITPQLMLDETETRSVSALLLAEPQSEKPRPETGRRY